jgi:hypothetical protein
MTASQHRRDARVPLVALDCMAAQGSPFYVLLGSRFKFMDLENQNRSTTVIIGAAPNDNHGHGH